MISVAKISYAAVGKGASYITASVMVNIPDKILALGLYPVNADPAYPFLSLLVEHFYDFFDFLLCSHDISCCTPEKVL